MTQDYLFVYGTLKRGTETEMHQLLARYADYLGEGTFQGTLYNIDYYPGVVPSDDPDDQVHGEVYRLQGPELVLPQLDDYEGITDSSERPTEYIRRRHPVRLKRGEELSCWIYIYNWPIEEHEVIESGAFVPLTSGRQKYVVHESSHDSKTTVNRDNSRQGKRNVSDG